MLGHDTQLETHHNKENAVEPSSSPCHSYVHGTPWYRNMFTYDREVSVEYPSGSVAVNWLLLKKSSLCTMTVTTFEVHSMASCAADPNASENPRSSHTTEQAGPLPSPSPPPPLLFMKYTLSDGTTGLARPAWPGVRFVHQLILWSLASCGYTSSSCLPAHRSRYVPQAPEGADSSRHCPIQLVVGDKQIPGSQRGGGIRHGLMHDWSHWTLHTPSTQHKLPNCPSTGLTGVESAEKALQAMLM